MCELGEGGVKFVIYVDRSNYVTVKDYCVFIIMMVCVCVCVCVCV